tara:strand:- start:1122 stop:1340 length:219 start_codon:yes stop_codon:yes gene_type:complete
LKLPILILIFENLNIQFEILRLHLSEELDEKEFNLKKLQQQLMDTLEKEPNILVKHFVEVNEKHIFCSIAKI